MHGLNEYIDELISLVKKRQTQSTLFSKNNHWLALHEKPTLSLSIILV